MDLGCLDFGCVSVSDKQSTETVLDSKGNDSGSSASKQRKISKEMGQSPLNALNKVTPQIKKHLHRKTSPLNWFPRKKPDSYLDRKIKLLQEVDGMNLTLDETLGDSNPHYCRVLREKMAAREAAHKAMEARKVSLVEASWCRILRASRIQRKEAESVLLNAEKSASEAFEAATALGVIMYELPNCPSKACQIETSSSVSDEKFTTLAVTAPFETTFDVDKQVAAAVKTAFVRLSNCPSFHKVEFKDLLWKISQNPDVDDHHSDRTISKISSECETESGSECKNETHDLDGGQKEYEQRPLDLEKLTMSKLVDIFHERLKCLKEDELSSIATIVATCGLNAALAEDEGNSKHLVVEPELPSLDKFLVKHASKLERDVQEAKEAAADIKDQSMDIGVQDKTEQKNDLASILVKHSSKFEKEINEAKKNREKDFMMKAARGTTFACEALPDLGSVLVKCKQVEDQRECKIDEQKWGRIPKRSFSCRSVNIPAIPSLDKLLVKHVSKLEKEVLEARQNNSARGEGKIEENVSTTTEKENIDLNKKGNSVTDCEGIDKILVKHVSRLEREKMRFKSEEYGFKVKGGKEKGDWQQDSTTTSLDQILIKHKPKQQLEREKASEEIRQVVSSSRKEARERELQELWGGLSLGNSIKPHLSKLERDKAAWIKAEEEERRLMTMKEGRGGGVGVN